MGEVYKRGAHDVALHDGLHDNFGCRAGFFRLQILSCQSRILRRILQKRQSKRDTEGSSTSEFKSFDTITINVILSANISQKLKFFQNFYRFFRTDER